jgi:hypothetical protein
MVDKNIDIQQTVKSQHKTGNKRTKKVKTWKKNPISTGIIILLLTILKLFMVFIRLIAGWTLFPTTTILDILAIVGRITAIRKRKW